jgi:hypothetical protein
MKSITFEQLESLRRLDACTLANAIETFRERLPRAPGFSVEKLRAAVKRKS